MSKIWVEIWGQGDKGRERCRIRPLICQADQQRQRSGGPERQAGKVKLVAAAAGGEWRTRSRDKVVYEALITMSEPVYK